MTLILGLRRPQSKHHQSTHHQSKHHQSKPHLNSAQSAAGQSLTRRASLSIGALVCAFSFSAATAQEPVRLGFMDPLSGTFASVGTSGLNVLEFAADYFYNSKGGILGGRMI